MGNQGAKLQQSLKKLVINFFFLIKPRKWDGFGTWGLCFCLLTLFLPPALQGWNRGSGTRLLEQLLTNSALKEPHSSFWISNKAVGILRQSLPLKAAFWPRFQPKTSNHTAEFLGVVSFPGLWRTSTSGRTHQQNSHHNCSKHNII